MFARFPIALFAILSLLPLLAGCGGAKAKRPASEVSAPDKAVIAAYDEVRLALVDDDMRKARNAGDRLVKALDAAGVSAALVKAKPPAKSISESPRIDAIRNAFKEVSKTVIAFCGDVEGYYVFDSPMIVDGNWLQTSKTPGNPFLGRALSPLADGK